MRVLNIHERRLRVDALRVGALIDSLGSAHDLLWPRQAWPPMQFDERLKVGAIGSHGLIRYRVVHYEPGHLIRFRFVEPAGFDGYHEYRVLDRKKEHVRLRHKLEMKTDGWASVVWLLILGPLHQALIEDSLSAAERSLGLSPTPKPWSLWVRLLRRSLSDWHRREPFTIMPRPAGQKP